MDPRERIALWVALVVLLVFVLVRSSSSFVGSQMSFVDLAEFDTLPADLKKTYYDTMVNGVAKEAGNKITQMYNALTPVQKDDLKKQADQGAKMVIEQIKSGKAGLMVLPPPPVQQAAPVFPSVVAATPAMPKEAVKMPLMAQQDAVKGFAPLGPPQQSKEQIAAKIDAIFGPQGKPMVTQAMPAMPGLVQMGGKIGETKSMPLQDFGMKMGLAPGQMQGKIAETKTMPIQVVGKIAA